VLLRKTFHNIINDITRIINISASICISLEEKIYYLIIILKIRAILFEKIIMEKVQINR